VSAPGPAEPPEGPEKTKARPGAGLDPPAYLLFASALGLGLTLLFTSAVVAFGVALVAGIAGAVACEWFARRGVQPVPRTPEPWRFDGFCVVVATLALLALGSSIGAEAVPVAWLLVALLVALGMAGVGSVRPPA
jgi:hypothetical protein